MKIFKHKAEVKVEKAKPIKEYLLRQSVLASGVTEYDEQARILIPQNDKKYVVYKVEYINSNGIDIDTDIENRQKINELVKALVHPFKIVDMNVRKQGLNENIEELEELLTHKMSDKRRAKIEERIDVMKFYNAEKYVTTFMYIALDDVDIFCKLAPSVLHIERLNKEQLIEYVSALNNELE
ncbi:MAG: hypothetical protein EOM50_07055 [Erysipelotrichia bacterium]|nr:hypothetical protein [Erysipelotrichia bacterium]NCC55025.1 hypothetical protein [Erysipelotrichia bacterium]